MAIPPKKPVAETPVVEEYKPTPVKIMAVKIRMRHPVTNVMIYPNRVTEILDLEDPINIFVKHQLEAGVFKRVDEE